MPFGLKRNVCSLVDDSNLRMRSLSRIVEDLRTESLENSNYKLICENAIYSTHCEISLCTQSLQIILCGNYSDDY